MQEPFVSADANVDASPGLEHDDIVKLSDGPARLRVTCVDYGPGPARLREIADLDDFLFLVTMGLGSLLDTPASCPQRRLRCRSKDSPLRSRKCSHSGRGGLECVLGIVAVWVGTLSQLSCLIMPGKVARHQVFSAI